MESIDSPWAVEGTRAHTLGELEAAYAFGKISRGQYLQRYTAWRKTVSNDEAKEMHKHIEAYVALLRRCKAELEEDGPVEVLLEQRVHPGIPESWGTSDAVLLGVQRIRIVDLKYGQGIRVSAVNNPQLKIYGVGALEEFGDILGDTEWVDMTIFQPRLDNISSWSLPATELRDWRDSILPVAVEALSEDAQFGPSAEACRFCPAAGVCKARMEYMTAQDFGQPVDELDEDELSEVLAKLPDIRAWCQAVEEYALDRAYSQGKPIPGWKVVLSGGKRTIPDATAAIQTLIDAGFKAEQVARFQLRTLGDLEKLVGKKELTELLGDLMIKTSGRPSLVDEDDPRPLASPASGARADFSDD